MNVDRIYFDRIRSGPISLNPQQAKMRIFLHIVLPLAPVRPHACATHNHLHW
jgi:hypothetical protein